MNKSSSIPPQQLPRTTHVSAQGNNAQFSVSETPQEQSATTVWSDARRNRPRVTRTGVLWVSMVVGLLLLVLLIVFIAQNQVSVPLQYFGWSGSVGLGLALFMSAVAGGLVIAIVGVARIMQLRSTTATQRKKLDH
ncbi:LapA family protein [Glutamicibacter protophormiae]|uniref:LapA family protein n=2 Tax=Glutamicibacter protophormiae TaxID=37930 RepID=UPI0035AC082D